MREIKFRVWDKSKDMMINKVSVHEIPDRYITLNEYFKFWQSKLMIFMQYIGLKDKNNKEIYDGDVVKLTGVAGEEGVGEVIFDKKNASFRIKTIENENKIDFWGFYQLLSVFRVKIEVIGNIFENPELLKGE